MYVNNQKEFESSIKNKYGIEEPELESDEEIYKIIYSDVVIYGYIKYDDYFLVGINHPNWDEPWTHQEVSHPDDIENNIDDDGVLKTINVLIKEINSHLEEDNKLTPLDKIKYN